ncbi:hypothetical protein KIW84_070346 [Lathyrus oleraceus]|uniref:Uncharacterized protein n=1 Tax=Pisum sativum TaxID=3888 RepID=A0A9D4VHB3_PEA|nr:hypothetical protein KIW84_070346 [Pisum sativum]
MMSHVDIPNSFWGHALLTAAYTLNRVPFKKVEKTPYEIWSEIRHERVENKGTRKMAKEPRKKANISKLARRVSEEAASNSSSKSIKARWSEGDKRGLRLAKDCSPSEHMQLFWDVSSGRSFRFMRGQVPEDQLLFDPEIERTARRLNTRTRRRRQQARQRQEQGKGSSTTQPPPLTPIMDPPPPPPASTPCVNSPRNTAQFANHQGRQAERKTGTLNLLYGSPFTGMDHEDPFAFLTKFYEIALAAGVDQAQELPLFKRLFPHALLAKQKIGTWIKHLQS